MRSVLKFGGTNLGQRERLLAAAELVRQQAAADGEAPVVVVSAVKTAELGCTDALIRVAADLCAGKRREALLGVELVGEALGRLSREVALNSDPWLGSLFEELRRTVAHHEGGRDEAVTAEIKAFGERLAARLFAALLAREGMEARAHDAWDLGMVTSDEYDGAMVLEQAYPALAAGLAGLDEVPVVTGFIGRNRAGEVTTFQRSGSDYTATVIARALGRGVVSEVRLFTDVPGLYSGPPDLVSAERLALNRVISYEIAEEGAWQKVKIPSGAIHPLVHTGIDLRILPLEGGGEGTLITDARAPDRGISFVTAKAVDFVNFQSAEMATRSGFLARIFAAAERHGMNIDLLSTTSTTVGMSIDNHSTGHLRAFVAELEGIPGCDAVRVLTGVAQVNIIGAGISRAFTEILHEAVDVLKMYRISVDAVSTGFGVNIGFIMDEAALPCAVDRLHFHLIEKKEAPAPGPGRYRGNPWT